MSSKAGALDVIGIEPAETLAWLLSRHYAKRRCPVSFAYGLYDAAVLVGVVTYGTPASAPLRSGVCGPEWSARVLELNRLCCDNVANYASRLVGQSLRLLPKPSIVVSYADTEQGHIGYVYQATNFLYTGLSAKRTNWTIAGQEGKHGATIGDISRGRDDRVGYMRARYGDAFTLTPRARKHRYVFIAASKQDAKSMRAALRYPLKPYPKGDSRHYDATTAVETQQRLILA